MTLVPESEQALAFWRDYCQAVISWPDMPTISGAARKYIRNPLRCVVSRQIISQRIGWGSTVLLYHEVLSCGHPHTFSPILEADYVAHRRRCAACGAREAGGADKARSRRGLLTAAPIARRRAALPTPPQRRVA